MRCRDGQLDGLRRAANIEFQEPTARAFEAHQFVNFRACAWREGEVECRAFAARALQGAAEEGGDHGGAIFERRTVERASDRCFGIGHWWLSLTSILEALHPAPCSHYRVNRHEGVDNWG